MSELKVAIGKNWEPEQRKMTRELLCEGCERLKFDSQTVVSYWGRRFDSSLLNLRKFIAQHCIIECIKLSRKVQILVIFILKIENLKHWLPQFFGIIKVNAIEKIEREWHARLFICFYDPLSEDEVLTESLFGAGGQVRPPLFASVPITSIFPQGWEGSDQATIWSGVYKKLGFGTRRGHEGHHWSCAALWTAVLFDEVAHEKSTKTRCA